MSYILKYEPRFKTDVENAFLYYKGIQISLEKKLKQSIKKAILQIEKNPMFQIRYQDIRCVEIDDFPYMIHFKVDKQSNTVFILACISTHQNPSTAWIK